MSDRLKVGIVGTGLQATRRASVFKDEKLGKIMKVAGTNIEKAGDFAENVGRRFAISKDWNNLVNEPDIDVVLICTPPDSHAEIAISAMERGKHILCEKPLARSVKEAEEMVKVARKQGVKLKCGFNHRYHPSISKAKKLFDGGAIGELDFMRCRYGICGRPDYEKEWRGDPKIAGGGHLMEQGIHGVDLFRWFAGDFSQVVGFTATRFWKMNPLEDNGFALFKTKHGQIASLHSSITQWKNLFSFEVYGREGYLSTEGLGGSYGTEKLTTGSREFDAPFKMKVEEFHSKDQSWILEWKEFMSAIEEDREPDGNGVDGLEALKLVQAVYDSVKNNDVMVLKQK